MSDVQAMWKKVVRWVPVSLAIAVLMFVLNIGMALPANAQSKVVNNCPKKQGVSLFLSLDTKSYAINICGGDLPREMVVAKKPSGKPELIELKDSAADGSFFEAYSGDKQYMLSKTAKGNVFTITKVTLTETLREAVSGW
jgi:hypothetical protein